jgi:hypothetical protein
MSICAVSGRCFLKSLLVYLSFPIGMSRAQASLGCLLPQQHLVSLFATIVICLYRLHFLFLDRPPRTHLSIRTATLPIIVFMRTHTDASACYLIAWPAFDVAIGFGRFG